jgi:ketosteroid isomerase-like protein
VVLMFGQNTPRTPDRDELQRLEHVWNAAHVRGDSEALSRLWADDLEVAVPKMPVMKKEELIKFVDSGRMKFQRYEPSDLNFRIYAQSAVVTGRLQRKREINGRAMEDDWRFTKVYQRTADGWRVVSFHASEAQAP